MTACSTRAWLAVAALVSVACLVPASAHATFPGRNGVIAVTRPSSTGPERVGTVRPDGSNLVFLPPVGYDPAWSPDGRLLLLVPPCRNCGPGSAGPNELVKVDANGRHLERIRFRSPPRWFGGPSEPSWSPHGTRFLFVRYGDEGGPTAIFASAANGHGQRLLYAAQSGYQPELPSWSPDGSEIAFISGERLWVMRSDGSSPHELPISVPGLVGSFDWSPNGREIALEVRPLDGPEEVVVARRDGSHPRVLRHGIQPFWSPDGKKLGSILPVIEGSNSVGGLLQIGDADGAHVRTIRRHIARAVWQPLQPDRAAD